MIISRRVLIHNKMIVLFTLSTIMLPVIAHSEDFVKVYTKENFLNELDKRNKFVMFYAPWCSHCTKFSPVWDNLAKLLIDDPKITIAKVDCTLQTQLCSMQDITGYPTLKLYKPGESEGKRFKGARDITTLTLFLYDELGDTKLPSTGPIELTDETLLDHVSKGNHFVKFYAPWCEACQKLAPTWNKLADNVKKDISIAKVDCTQNQKACSMFDVLSYPTLMWIQNGKQVENYYGDRAIKNLEAYVSQMLKPRQMKPEGGKESANSGKSVVALTDDDFYQTIENGYTFVKFFAPWCGHCKRLAPTWEELAKTLSADENIKIAHVDCTLEENKDLCNDQEVEGYPTLFLYLNGVKIGVYNGSRVLADFLEFVKRHMSPHDEF